MKMKKGKGYRKMKIYIWSSFINEHEMKRYGVEYGVYINEMEIEKGKREEKGKKKKKKKKDT